MVRRSRSAQRGLGARSLLWVQPALVGQALQGNPMLQRVQLVLVLQSRQWLPLRRRVPLDLADPEGLATCFPRCS